MGQDARECPRCGNRCILEKAELIEQEDSEIIDLSRRLVAIQKTDDSDLLSEAKRIITKLREVNLRFNNPNLDRFITDRQRELFYS
ncbi:MAG: hypothetical protein SVZ03_04860 [Spirochaetota bacterium]|nr:hypothetical protein [Spirochaetota bacterium]